MSNAVTKSIDSSIPVDDVVKAHRAHEAVFGGLSKEQRDEIQKYIATQPDRYSSCPCGSGKKFKFCCFKAFMDSERKRLLADSGKEVK